MQCSRKTSKTTDNIYLFLTDLQLKESLLKAQIARTNLHWNGFKFSSVLQVVIKKIKI